MTLYLALGACVGLAIVVAAVGLLAYAITPDPHVHGTVAVTRPRA